MLEATMIDHDLSPAALKVHKPTRSGKGAALKLDLRLVPEYGQSAKGTTFISDVKGGLFLEVAPQLATDDDGNATFDWENTVSAKLGLADITAILVGFRCRWASRPLPEAIQKRGAPDGQTISLFHRYKADDTVIELMLTPEGSKLSISRKSSGQVNRGFIALALTEELLVDRYLDLALTQFLRVGKR